MKIMLISASFLFLSFSAFSDLKTSDTLQALQVGEIFSELLPTGTKVGICEVKQSQSNGNNYIIEVKEGRGLVGIYHNVKYSLQTTSSIKYNNDSFMITNSYKFSESGISGRRIMQMKAKKLLNGELKVIGIFIETKNTNASGEAVLDMEQSVHCLNRL